MNLKKYRVHISNWIFGFWDIKAKDADKAKEIAEARIAEDDTSWITNGDGNCEVEEVEEIPNESEDLEPLVPVACIKCGKSGDFGGGMCETCTDERC